MNYLPLAALLIASISLAISITVLVLALTPRPDPKPKITQQIHIPEPWEQVANAAAARAAREATTYQETPLGRAERLASTPPRRPGPTTQMIRRIDANLPRDTGRRAARKDHS